MQNIFGIIRKAKQEYPVDVIKLAQDIGIKVCSKFLPQDISGELVHRDGQYQINYNNMHPITRQRFTISHEIGHYIYHRSLIGDGVNDSKAYRTTNGDNFNPNITPKHETEANRFAASLLMPQELVDSLRAAGKTIDEMASDLGVSKHAMSIRVGEPYDPT